MVKDWVRRGDGLRHRDSMAEEVIVYGDGGDHR